MVSNSTFNIPELIFISDMNRLQKIKLTTHKILSLVNLY